MNALLQLELRGALRRARMFWILAGYVGVLGGVVAWTYPTQLRFDPVLSRLGREVALAFTAAQLVLVVLVTPALSVAGLAKERELGALELLLVTPVTRWEVVVGKFIAALAHVLLLIGASLPLTAVSFMLGGVTPFELLAAYAVVVAVAGVCAALGVLHASGAVNTLGALMNAYLALPLYGVLFVALWLTGLTGAALVFVESLFAFVYFSSRRPSLRAFAYVAMGTCCLLFLPLLASSWDRAAAWWITVAIAFVGASVAIVLGCLNEARKRLEPARVRKPTRAGRWRKAWQTASPLERPYQTAALIPDHVNPVLTYELRHHVLGGERYRWQAWAVAALLAIVLVLAARPAEAVLLCAQLHLLLLLTASAGGSGVIFAREFERKTVASLRAAGLTAFEVFSGKLLAALAIPLLLNLTLAPLMLSTTSLSVTNRATWWLLCLVSGLLATLIGVSAALLTRSVRRALGGATAAIAVLGVHALLLAGRLLPEAGNFLNPFFLLHWALRSDHIAWIAQTALPPLWLLAGLLTAVTVRGFRLHFEAAA